MRAYYFKITGQALIDAFRACEMRLPEDARVIKTGAAAGLNNDFWVMVESETEGSELQEGSMPEERKPEFNRAEAAARKVKTAEKNLIEAFAALLKIAENHKRRTG